MANEISLQLNVRVSNGNFVHDVNPGQLQYDQATGSGGNPGVISTTTTAASISFGSVTPGYVYIRNMSTGETVRVRTTSGLEVGDFAPGKVAIWPKGSATWQLQATTAGGTPLVDVRGFST